MQLEGTEVIAWPVGTLWNGMVNLGNNRVLAATIDESGLPDVGEDEVKRQADAYMNHAAHVRNARRKRLTDRRESA